MSTLDESYLQYPRRRYGMDHDRYDWSMLPARPRLEWPNGARVALWVTTSVQWFPLDTPKAPIAPLGGMVTPYPDLRHYSLRDYGNRVGFYRHLKVFDSLGIRPSIALNAAIVRRHPRLVREVVERGWEIVGHGVDMSTIHHGRIDEGEEARWIDQALGELRTLGAVRGWLSPVKSESRVTLDLLAERGIDYVCDWNHDDLPVPLRTRSGRAIWALPHAHLTSDAHVLVHYKQTERDWLEQVCDHFDVLYRESATAGGRIVSMSVHPWVTGQPYRIGALKEALEHALRHDGVWVADGGQIFDAFRAAT